MKKTFLLFIILVGILSHTKAQWTQGTGIDGGDFRCLAKVGTDIYAGSQYGGVYRSTNNGVSWSPLFIGLPGGVSIKTIMNNGSSLFAGTGYWSLSGQGVYRSDDNGATWIQKNNGIQVSVSGSFMDMDITGMAKNTSYIFASTRANGIYRSADNGENWVKVFDQYSSDSSYREIFALCTVGEILIAGGTYGDAMYRSTDNGATWTPIITGLPSGFITYGLISNGAITYATTSHGFYMSPSNGDYWIGINNGISQPNSAANGALSATGSVIYASTNDGSEGPKTYKSIDGGTTFAEIPAMAIYRVAALLADGNTVLACNLGGIYNNTLVTGGVIQSLDSGETWSPISIGLQGLSCMALTSSGTDIYAGSRYYSGVFKSSDNGNTWTKSVLPGPTTNYQLLSMTTVGSVIYAGNNTYTIYGGVFKSTDNGQSWVATAAISKPVYAMGANASYVFAGTSNDGMRRSSNGGSTWTTINTGLPTIGEKSIRALTIDGTNIFIGTSRGVFVSSNDGTNWSAANGGIGSPGYGSVKAIVAKGDTLIAGSTSGGIIRSYNKGVSWISISSSISIGSTNALYLDGTRLYAGGRGGVFCSNDWGETWNSLNGTFPIVSEVYSLMMANGNLYAGIYGQSVWHLLNPNTPPPSAFSVTGSGNYCEGSAGIPVGLSGSELNVTYKLLKNDVVIASLAGTGAPLSFGNHTAGTYTIMGYGIGGIITMAGSAVITEIPTLPVSVSIAADQNNVCEGTLITFTATPVNGGNPTYQWYLNNNPVGTNSQQFTLTPANGDDIHVVLTSDEVCTSNNPTASNTIDAVINALMPVSAVIAEDANNVCIATTVTLTATPVNGGTNPSWQWFLNGVATGSNQPTYSFIPVNNDQVHATVTSDLACASNNPATSNTVVFTVNEPLPVSVTISEDANNVCEGTNVNLTAIPVNGGTAPSYQWFVNNVSAGTSQGTYSFIPSNGDQVYALLTSNQECITGNPATSNTVAFTVNAPVPVSVTISEDLNNYCGSQEVTFTAIPLNGGSSPEYFWMVNAAPAGENLPEFTYTPEDQDEVYVVMNSNLECSAGSPVASNFITIEMEEQVTPTITITASENPVLAGVPVTFTALIENGGNPTFEWFVNEVSVATGPTYTYLPLDGDVVYAIMTSTLECVTTSTATSNSIIIDIIIGVTEVPTSGLKAWAAGSILYIENFTDPKGIMELYDLKGTRLSSRNIAGKQLIKINTGLTTGLYLVRITGDNIYYTTKIFLN